jgi:hypothetical protein
MVLFMEQQETMERNAIPIKPKETKPKHDNKRKSSNHGGGSAKKAKNKNTVTSVLRIRGL